MASVNYLVELNNRSATYTSWPLIWFELEENMGTIDAYSYLPDNPEVIDIHREESPNFGRRIFIYSVNLTPAPTAVDPVRIYIDTWNKIAYVDPDSSHAQAGEILQIFHPATKFFNLLPGVINEINFLNCPVVDMRVGLRWRKAYSG